MAIQLVFDLFEQIVPFIYKQGRCPLRFKGWQKKMWVVHWQPVGRQHSIFGRTGDQWFQAL